MNVNPCVYPQVLAETNIYTPWIQYNFRLTTRVI